ncbi:hypothetical protein V8C86DRAFT_2603960 [Haematococcus lacustris]
MASHASAPFYRVALTKGNAAAVKDPRGMRPPRASSSIRPCAGPAPAPPSTTHPASNVTGTDPSSRPNSPNSGGPRVSSAAADRSTPSGQSRWTGDGSQSSAKPSQGFGGSGPSRGCRKKGRDKGKGKAKRNAYNKHGGIQQHGKGPEGGGVYSSELNTTDPRPHIITSRRQNASGEDAPKAGSHRGQWAAQGGELLMGPEQTWDQLEGGGPQGQPAAQGAGQLPKAAGSLQNHEQRQHQRSQHHRYPAQRPDQQYQQQPRHQGRRRQWKEQGAGWEGQLLPAHSPPAGQQPPPNHYLNRRHAGQGHQETWVSATGTEGGAAPGPPNRSRFQRGSQPPHQPPHQSPHQARFNGGVRPKPTPERCLDPGLPTCLPPDLPLPRGWSFGVEVEVAASGFPQARAGWLRQLEAAVGPQTWPGWRVKQVPPELHRLPRDCVTSAPLEGLQGLSTLTAALDVLQAAGQEGQQGVGGQRPQGVEEGCWWGGQGPGLHVQVVWAHGEGKSRHPGLPACLPAHTCPECQLAACLAVWLLREDGGRLLFSSLV